MAETARHRDAREYAEIRLEDAVLACKNAQTTKQSDEAWARAERWAPIVLALNASTDVDDE